MIKKILISCDLTRIKKENNKIRPFHNIRLKKYYDLLSWQIKKGTNLPVGLLGWDIKGFSQKKFYNLVNEEYSSEFSWVNVFDKKNLQEEVINYYGNLIKDSLVIYIEMSDTQKRLHNMLGVPYIDISVHPVRYMSDHFFSLSTNNFEIYERLKKYEMNEDQFFLGARLLKVQIDQNMFKAEKGSALLVGQTKLDRSLIFDGKLVGLTNYLKKIEDLSKKFNVVYFKSHPYVKDKSLYDAIRKIENIKFTNENIYRLLSCSEISTVIGISSSVLYEAKYFSKKVVFLNKKFNLFEKEFNEKNYVSIDSVILQPSFWQDIIFGECEEKVPYIPIKLDSNTMRAALNDFWGYTDYDPVVRVVKKSNVKIEVSPSTHSGKENYKKGIVGNIVNITDKLNLNFIGELVRFYALNKKLEKEAKKFIGIKDIQFITYRPEAPFGGRGGAGAVQSAVKTILKDKLENLSIRYSFSEKDGVWHSKKNKYFVKKRFPKIYSEESRCFQFWASMVFVFDKAKSVDTLYVTQDIPTAYALSLMRRKYILIVHSQGARLDEIDALGEYFNRFERHIINVMEDKALLNASKVYFPSRGARLEFEKSKYKTRSVLDKVKFSDTCLYNTLYYIPTEVEHEYIKKNDELLTFISVGTVTSSKGQDRTFEYLKHLATKRPELKIRWICVGKGPLLDSLVKDYSNMKISNLEVQFLQKVEYAQVQFLLKISDIYIMLHRKSIFDLATLEAMNRNCMLILSRCGGNIEFNKAGNVVFSDDDFDFDKLKIEKLKNINKSTYIEYFGNEKFKKQWTDVLLMEVKENE